MIDYEIIDNYLSNSLTEAEKKAFELQLQSDKALQEAVQLYAAIGNEKQATVAGDEAAFRKLLEPNQQLYFTKKTTTIKPQKGKLRTILWLASAAAAVAILIFTINPFANKSYTNSELYSAYNTVESVEEITRGTNDNTIFNKAAAFYNAKNFDSAIVYFTQLRQTNVQAVYLLGNSYLQKKQYSSAIENFDVLITGNSVYKEKAKFTKAIVYLAMNNSTKAKEQLNTITTQEGYYKKAQELLKKLN